MSVKKINKIDRNCSYSRQCHIFVDHSHSCFLSGSMHCTHIRNLTCSNVGNVKSNI